LPILRDSILVNPGAELNSDGLDELSDTVSISSNSDPDTDESDMELSGKDEEEEDSEDAHCVLMMLEIISCFRVDMRGCVKSALRN
jgi:hypothetical protein